MSDVNKILVGGAAAVALSAAVAFYSLTGRKPAAQVEAEPIKPQPETVIALLGDIGGTNVRLTLKRLHLKTRTSETILELKKYNSQHVKSLQETIEDFLKQLPVSRMLV